MQASWPKTTSYHAERTHEVCPCSFCLERKFLYALRELRTDLPGRARGKGILTSRQPSYATYFVQDHIRVLPYVNRREQ